MSTGLPPDARLLHTLPGPDGSTETWVYEVPVPAPEPPSRAERMADWWAKYLGFDSQSRTQRENLVADIQAMIDHFGLVCRDEVPTVTQAREAIVRRIVSCGHWDTENAPDPMWLADQATKAMAELGSVRPDQEPDT